MKPPKDLAADSKRKSKERVQMRRSTRVETKTIKFVQTMVQMMMTLREEELKYQTMTTTNPTTAIITHLTNNNINRCKFNLLLLQTTNKTNRKENKDSFVSLNKTRNDQITQSNRYSQFTIIIINITF